MADEAHKLDELLAEVRALRVAVRGRASSRQRARIPRLHPAAYGYR